MQFQLRTGADFKLNKHFSVVPFGYVYTLNEQYGKQPSTYINNEHRFWEQVVYKHHIGKFKLDHRFGMSNVSSRYTRRMRKAPLQTKVFTINKNDFVIAHHGKAAVDKDDESVFFSFYDEIFFSWGKKVTYNEPDQNKAFVGIGLPINKSFTFNSGFLYQMLVKENGLKQENNLGSQVMATYNIDLSHQ